MLYKICQFLARSDLFFYLILWLMVLLITGTIAEQQQGLYYATQNYFSVYFFFLFGIIPLPGTYTILTGIFICLLCKLGLDKWRTSNIGSLITHISGLMLLLGGFLTAHFSHEGYVTIKENEAVNYMSDYYKLELIVTSNQLKNHQIIFKQEELKSNQLLSNHLLPFKILITEYCNHCAFINNQLKALPTPKDNEQFESIMVVNINNQQIFLKHDDPDFKQITLNNQKYYLKLRHQITQLPFTIKLDKFSKKFHPGTNIAKEYQSDVTIYENNQTGSSKVTWHSSISMNQPLRYKGYTFYQSSFYDKDNQYTTVLAAVYNVGQSFPYIASIILCIGLLIHLTQRIPKLIKNNVINSIVIIISCSFLNFGQNNYCYANQEIQLNLDYTKLKDLPVLHDGRIKPLDSFARITLKSIANNHETINNQNALTWLINLLFNPKEDYKNSVFYVSNPELQNLLKLPSKTRPYYSFKEILPGIKQNIELISSLENKYTANKNTENKNTGETNQDLTPSMHELLNLYHNILIYFDLSRSFSLLLPELNAAILQEEINFKPANHQYNLVSYYEVLPYKQILSNRVTKILNYQSSNINNKTRLLLFNANLFRNLETDKININLKIIPSFIYQNNSPEWIAPWEAITTDNGTPISAKYLNLLQRIVYAYYKHDAQEWDKSTSELKNFAVNIAADPKLNDKNINAKTMHYKLLAEYYYNNLKPLNKSLIFYIIALILSIISVFSTVTHANYVKSSNHHLLKNLAVISFMFGFICHIAGVVTRMYILQRPPVSNLYESILFVGLVTAALSLTIHYLRTEHLGILIGSLICSALQFIANSYAQTGDSLVVLIAVLNNNFWLGTHVVAITCGYACCLIFAALSHITLFKIAFKKNLGNLSKYILALGLLSLFLTMLGTILGGIWADQSWGRFWGWDPKENGAMLICLWLIAILHGRISGQLNNLMFTSFAALTSIIVMLAWFGVNLLSTGLHSYGFTENIATNLVLFIILELTLILGITIIINKQNLNRK